MALDLSLLIAGEVGVEKTPFYMKWNTSYGFHTEDERVILIMESKKKQTTALFLKQNCLKSNTTHLLSKISF